MPSSLYGIFNVQRALQLNQSALNIINNNIANINTEGYSKQSLDISQKIIVSSGNQSLVDCQSGAGATIDSINRNRDIYLDASYRDNNSDYNYAKELSQNVALIETKMNELSNDGINNALNDFYNAASQLSLQPTNSLARNNFVQMASDLCDKFNDIYNQLTKIRTDLVGDSTNAESLTTAKITTTCFDLNKQLEALTDINKTIALSTSEGITPNSLLDKRDLLLDQISEFIPITVTQGVNNLVTVSLGDTILVQGSNRLGYFETTAGDSDNPAIVKIVDSNGADILANANDDITSGKIAGILDVAGSNPSKLTISGILDSLNTLAIEFATEVNTIQNDGKYINNSINPPVLASFADTTDIFVEQDGTNEADYTNMTAGNIRINSNIYDNPYLVATAKSTSAANETGDGENVLIMSQLRNEPLENLGYATTEGFLSSLVGKIGIQVKNVDDTFDAKKLIFDQIKQTKESTIGVNLDEELSDLIRFQRSYEASAKMLSVIDKALQQIIAAVGS